MINRPLCHISDNKINKLPNKTYKMLLACSPDRAHQTHTITEMQKILSKNFKVTNFSIFDALYKFGRVKTQEKIFSMISNFDVFMIWLSKPALDFNFYKKLKKINPSITIVYFEGDSDVIFPIYSKRLVKDFDFFIALDSLDVADVVSQMGCKSICLGNVISQKDFYHIQNTKKKYEVMFYGGLKFQGGSRQQILEFLKQKGIPIHCFGKSFGYISSKELNKKINQSKIVISLNEVGFNPKTIKLPKNYKISTHIKSKIFEAILCKTFVLSEEIENMDRFFIPNKELVSFSNKLDLVTKINFFLKNNKERERITLASYNKTLRLFESKKQYKKMSNIIFKIVNEKKGFTEKFEYLSKKYRLKHISEKGIYEVTNTAFVNFNAQLIHKHLKNHRFREFFLDMKVLIYGFPVMYIKNQVFHFIADTYVKIREIYRNIIKN